MSQPNESESHILDERIENSLTVYFKTFAGHGSDPETARLALLALIGLAIMRFSAAKPSTGAQKPHSDPPRLGGDFPITSLGLSDRVCHAVVRNGTRTVDELLADLIYGKLDGYHGIGIKSAQEIVDKMREAGYGQQLEAILALRGLSPNRDWLYPLQ